MDFLQNLPEEMIFEIAATMDFENLAKLSAVSKRLNKTIHSTRFWTDKANRCSVFDIKEYINNIEYKKASTPSDYMRVYNELYKSKCIVKLMSFLEMMEKIKCVKKRVVILTDMLKFVVENKDFTKLAKRCMKSLRLKLIDLYHNDNIFEIAQYYQYIYGESIVFYDFIDLSEVNIF